MALSLDINCVTGNAEYSTKEKGKGKVKYNFCKFDHIELINKSIPLNITMENTINLNSDDVELVDFSQTNKVKFIPNEIFKKFTNLTFVYAQTDIKLDILEASYFNDAVNLKILRIMQNPFTYLVSNLFAGAKNLEVINFQNNAIETIHEKAFEGLDHLAYLYLDRNQIATLSMHTFSYLKNLQMLHLKLNICIQKDFEKAGDSQDFTVFMQTVENELKIKCNLETILKDHQTSIDAIKDLQGDFGQKIESKVNEIIERMFPNNTHLEPQPVLERQEMANLTASLDQLKSKVVQQEKLNDSIFGANYLILFCLLVLFNILFIMGIYFICLTRRNLNFMQIHHLGEYEMFEMQ